MISSETEHNAHWDDVISNAWTIRKCRQNVCPTCGQSLCHLLIYIIEGWGNWKLLTLPYCPFKHVLLLMLPIFGIATSTTGSPTWTTAMCWKPWTLRRYARALLQRFMSNLHGSLPHVILCWNAQPAYLLWLITPCIFIFSRCGADKK